MNSIFSIMISIIRIRLFRSQCSNISPINFTSLYALKCLSICTVTNLNKLIVYFVWMICNSTRSSDIITLQRPPAHSHLKLTDRSYTHHAPILWNSLPKHLHQPSTHCSLTSSTYPTPLLALSSLQFHSHLKTFLFLHHSILCFHLWQAPLFVLWPPDPAHFFKS